MTTTKERLAAKILEPITIGPDDVLNVQAGLIFRNGSPAIPHFVAIESDCPFLNILYKNADGTFDIHNPSTSEVNFRFRAHHLHSEEREPIQNIETTTKESPHPPPTVCALDGYASEADLLAEAAIREAADAALQEEIDALEAEAGGFWIEGADQEENLLAWISPRNPGAIDDDDFNSPFVTIQGYLNAVGEPVDIADERRLFTALVANGFFDEDLNVPAARSIRLLAMGPVVLGDGAGRYYNESTTPRNIIYNYDQNKEFSDNPRPCLALGSIAPRVDAKSTHLAYNTGWIISGSIIGAPGATASTTIELYLEGCHIQRGIDFSQPSGIVNTYLRRSRLSDDGETGYCLQGDHLQLMISEMTRYEEAIDIEYINRSVHDLIQGNVTIATIGSEIPPSGIYGSDFATGLTWNGPAGSFNVDNVTAALAIIRGLSFAGGATLGNCKNIGFAYAPATPGDWPTIPTNIWDALDQLGRIEFGEMYCDANTAVTVITAPVTWYEVFAGMVSGVLRNTVWINPANQARIQVKQTAFYKVQYCANIDNNDGLIAEMGISINTVTPERKSVAYQTFDTPNNYEQLAGQAILLLTANDTIRLMIRDVGPGSGNIIVRQANVSIEKLLA